MPPCAAAPVPPCCHRTTSRLTRNLFCVRDSPSVSPSKHPPPPTLHKSHMQSVVHPSATEGADSNPVSGQGTPSEEKVGQVEMGKRAWSAKHLQSFFDRDSLSGTHAVTTKVTQGAKTFGSFLYSAANKAGSKIKESVKANVRIRVSQGREFVVLLLLRRRRRLVRCVR